ncbi:MAG TPA: response regulator, partial [Burkholderiaceae bacterium]|nr:response regulator [Burkholderiaceae bacterium]
SLAFEGDPLAVQCAIYRLLCGALDLLKVGFLVFDGELKRSRSGRWIARIKAAGAGLLMDDERFTDVLQRLQLQERHPPSPGENPRLRRAEGTCPRTNARITFASLRSKGVLFDAQFTLPPVVQDEDMARPEACDGVVAWLVHDDEIAAGSLARRLQRLGWATIRFDSVSQALRRLRQRQATDTARPALVVAVESDTLTVDQAALLRAVLPNDGSVHCIYAAAAGSTVLGAEEMPGYDVRVWPLSPQELSALTMWPASDMPLSPDRPRVLVVNDDEVNRVIVARMAQSLGCEVRMACDGDEAIERCREEPPAVVLMDLAMPRLNGIDSTLQLRALQRVGVIPPFRIIAVTAQADEGTRLECLRSGMDAHLPKPLQLPALQVELRRAMAGCGAMPTALQPAKEIVMTGVPPAATHAVPPTSAV